LNLGLVYYLQRNFKDAILCFEQSSDIASSEHFDGNLAKINFYYGEILSNKFISSNDYHDLDKAIQAYKNALEFYQTQKPTNHTELSKVLTSLGKALLLRGVYSEAIPTLEKAREFWQKQKSLPELALTLYELGKAYHRQGYLERSRLYFKDSLRLFLRLDQPDKSARVLASLGNLELQMGKIDVAINHLSEAKQYYQSQENQNILKEIEHLLSCVPAQSFNTPQGEYVKS
jgi:tetratricopeptide (TPR) repeat protein